MGNEHGKAGGRTATPAGIQSMDEALQKRFAKGIQFNMKIVLKGDRNTGKTCLFNRMGGKPFQEAYIPTMEIQVTSILWSYKVTSDTVKVEVWDVVDKGKVQKKETKGGLKIFNTTPDEEEEEEGEGEGRKKVLDATFLNVYKGCNGVVLVFDMTKMWTWKYVERELPKIPFDIPVIVLGNFRDLGEHRVKTRDEIHMFLRSVRPVGSSEILYAESSMRNAFGLMHLHKFLSIPFLQMQQDMLLQQIQVSREQMLAARDELSTASTTEDQNYDMFLARLQQAAEQRKKQAQQQREEESELASGTGRQSGMEPEQTSTRSSSSASSSAHQGTTPTPGIATTTAEQQPSTAKKKSRLLNFLSSSSKNKKEPEPNRDSVPVSGVRGTSVSTTTDIEEFVPDGDVDSFLEEEEEEEVDEGGESEEDDEDESEAHPVIARDEDLSSPDEEEAATPPSPPKPISQEPSPVVVRRNDSSSQEPSPVVRRDKPVKPLKSAKEVELTESEEEEEDEGEEEQTVPRSTVRDKQRDIELFWGKTAPEGAKDEDEIKPKAKAKSGGLLLEWAVPEQSATKPSSKKKESPKGSPDVSEGRKERRRKPSKKGSGSRRKKEAAASGSNGTTGANDPFGGGALDAWLNSEDILQPTVAKGGGGGGGGEVGEEAGEDPENTSHKKTRKHRDRTSSDGTRHKKKLKSRHSAKDADQTF